MTATHAVTGALGYTGKALTERLLAGGDRVVTLTNSPDRPNPFGDALTIHRLAFEDPEALRRALDGVDTLFNTYWVRFDHRLFTFEQAVTNTRALFAAAGAAGVRRIVHVSILHATAADDLGYYRGKHALEDALAGTGIPHAIVRPGVLFGRGDILVNNIAWALRRLPLFGVFGDGGYRLRPLHVDDMADLLVRCGDQGGDQLVDAVGPESFRYRDLVATLADILGIRRRIVRVPPWLGYLVGRCINPLVGDVLITREEIAGLMRGLLDSDAPASGTTRLTEWAAAHREQLGRRYASELRRRIRRDVAYQDL